MIGIVQFTARLAKMTVSTFCAGVRWCILPVFILALQNSGVAVKVEALCKEAHRDPCSIPGLARF